MDHSDLHISLTTPNGLEYRQPLGLFINNEFVASKSGERITTVNPTNGKAVTAVFAASEDDVDTAVQAARAAFRGPWSETTGTKRSEYLTKLADLVEQHAEILASIESWDNGKPYHDSLTADLEEVKAVLRYYAGWSDKITGEVIETEKNQHVYTVREPIGVCGQIIPWNYPLSMAAWKLAPAVAAGNTVVIKAAEQTPLSILYFATLVKQAGFPAGVVNILNGLGKQAGAALAGHTDVDKIAFTGSTQTAREIVKLASVNLKNMSLETGGKTPLIVFEDADLDKAAYWAHIGVMSNAGQVCTANSRIFVHDSVHDKFVDLFVRRVNAALVGDPFKPETFQGPQVTKAQFDRVMSYISAGIKEGATPVTGAKPLNGVGTIADGYFIEPTVFTGVRDDMAIAREEIFGPVTAIFSFNSEDEVVERANNSEFGLSAALFTKDSARLHRVSRKLESGTVWCNSSNNSDIRVPFGGVKQSGFGRECGKAGIEAYTQTKAVFVNLE